MKLKAFPFDTQECPFTLGSMGYSKKYLDVVPKSVEDPSSWWADPTRDVVQYDRSAVDMSDFKHNSEFAISKITVSSREQKYGCCPDPYPTLVYTFHLRRASLTYLSGTILPLIIITIVSHVGFLLGAISLARTALGITAMLTTSSVYTAISPSVPSPLPSSFPSSLPPFFPSSLFPFFPSSLPPFLPSSLLPFLSSSHILFLPSSLSPTLARARSLSHALVLLPPPLPPSLPALPPPLLPSPSPREARL